jgi:hypothetical protein
MNWFTYYKYIQPTRRGHNQDKKLKPLCDLFIEHLPNLVTLVITEVEQEDEATIMSNMKSLSLVWTEESDRWLTIN